MATLSPTTVGRSGVVITTPGASATSGGDAFATTGQEYLVVKNGDGSDHTVQFLIDQTVDGVTPTSPTHNVVAGDYAIFGPFQPGIFGNTNGLVQVRYSAVTSVKVQVIKCVPAGPGQ